MRQVDPELCVQFSQSGGQIALLMVFTIYLNYVSLSRDHTAIVISFHEAHDLLHQCCNADRFLCRRGRRVDLSDVFPRRRLFNPVSHPKARARRYSFNNSSSNYTVRLKCWRVTSVKLCHFTHHDFLHDKFPPDDTGPHLWQTFHETPCPTPWCFR